MTNYEKALELLENGGYVCTWSLGRRRYVEFYNAEGNIVKSLGISLVRKLIDKNKLCFKRRVDATKSIYVINR